jgi:hypothetical protein
LSNERHRPQNPASGKLPEPDQDRSLESAIAEFGGGLSPDGTGDGDEDPPDYADCFRSLEDKARELGVLYDRWQPAVEGGREHDLTYDESSGTYWKFTKPAKAAYAVDFDLRPANVILEDSGLIVPIDSIPVRLSDDARRMFE